MFRRVVCLALLPGLLLMQSARIGHCHGVGQLPGHDLLAHIHTNVTSKENEHCQNHHHEPDAHPREQNDEGDSPEPMSQPAPQPGPLSEHDFDAVYVASMPVTAEVRSQVNGSGLTCLLAMPDDFALSVAASLNPHSRSSSELPPFYGGFCPLYVRHLILLI
jgi:hypothetical protein